MPDGSPRPMDLITQLTLQKSAFRKAEYTTLGADGKSGGLKFEQIEDVVPEARKYHGFIGEVKATVDGLLEDEIRRRDSSQGEQQTLHGEKVSKLASMKTVIDMDLGLIYADIGPYDDDNAYKMLLTTEDPQARAMLKQSNRDKRMRQYDLPTTRQKLDDLRIKREQEVQVHPEDGDAQQWLEATNNIIMIVDRITPNNQPIQNQES